MLRLVESEEMELMLQQMIEIPMQQRIGSEHEVRWRNFPELRFPVRPLQHQHGKIGRKFRGFALPVHDHTRRGDHKRRQSFAATRFDPGKEMCQGLERFSETHVVGEDAIKTVSREKLHPAITICTDIRAVRREDRSEGAPARCSRNRGGGR